MWGPYFKHISLPPTLPPTPQHHPHSHTTTTTTTTHEQYLAFMSINNSSLNKFNT